jgi:hypothetical protein
MLKLMTILGQIADRSLLPTLNGHMAQSLGFIWKWPVLKMVTSLQPCMMVKTCSEIQFLNAEGIKPAEIYGRMLAQIHKN